MEAIIRFEPISWATLDTLKLLFSNIDINVTVRLREAATLAFLGKSFTAFLAFPSYSIVGFFMALRVILFSWM